LFRKAAILADLATGVLLATDGLLEIVVAVLTILADLATGVLLATDGLLEIVVAVLNGIDAVKYNLKLNYTCPKHNRQ
jgi:hypothetical protein